MKVLNALVRAGMFEDIISGCCRVIATRRNPRKDRYFKKWSPAPDAIRIRVPGMAHREGVIIHVLRITETEKDWKLHLGAPI